MPPAGESGERLEVLVDKIAGENQAPAFVPHLTLVGNVITEAINASEAKKRVEELAGKVDRFTLTLEGYGYKDEERRSLYLLANAVQLEFVFEEAAKLFPQVNSEHFRTVPHLSILYGNYPEALKQQIINEDPMFRAECSIESFDLYNTAGPISEWRPEQTFLLQ